MKKALLVFGASAMVFAGFATVKMADAAKTFRRRAPITIKKSNSTPPPSSSRDSAHSSSRHSTDNKDRDYCYQRKTALDSREQRYEEMKAKKAAYDKELINLQDRINYINKEKSRIDRYTRALERSLDRERKGYDKRCADVKDCHSYEQYVDDLENRLKPLEISLNNISIEIDSSNRKTADLERQIPPIKTSYERSKCGALVPGKTSQATIDKCFKLMSDWNRYQGELNDLKRRVPYLEQQYAMYSNQLRSIQRPMDEYNNYLSRNCSSSAKVAKIRDMRSRKQKYDKLDDVIKRAAKRLEELDKVQIKFE